MVRTISESGLERNIGRRVRWNRAPYEDLYGELSVDEKGFFIKNAKQDSPYKNFRGTLSKVYIKDGVPINISYYDLVNKNLRVNSYVVAYRGVNHNP